MNIEEIKALAHLIHETGLSEVEIEEKGVKIRIVGPRPVEVHTAPAALPAAMPMPVQVAAASEASSAPAPAAPAPAAPAAAPAEAAEAIPAKWKAVESPMVGTFYRAPAPDADNYVEVGDTVKADTVLCIVEAMKLMNEIKAECSGVVRKITCENATPVEFGQPMFYIEPA